MHSSAPGRLPHANIPVPSPRRGARPERIFTRAYCSPLHLECRPSPTWGTPTPGPGQNAGPSVHLCPARLGGELPEGGCQAWPFSTSSAPSGCRHFTPSPTLPPPHSPPPTAETPQPKGGEPGALAFSPLPKQGCLLPPPARRGPCRTPQRRGRSGKQDGEGRCPAREEAKRN